MHGLAFGIDRLAFAVRDKAPAQRVEGASVRFLLSLRPVYARGCGGAVRVRSIDCLRFCAQPRELRVSRDCLLGFDNEERAILGEVIASHRGNVPNGDVADVDPFRLEPRLDGLGRRASGCLFHWPYPSGAASHINSRTRCNSV